MQPVPDDPWSAEGRCPGDQLRGEQHLLVLVRRVARLVEDQVGGRPAELLTRLADGGEGNGGCSGEVDVVVADDGELFGDVESRGGGLLQEAERHQVVGAEGRRRSATGRDAGQAFACRTS